MYQHKISVTNREQGDRESQLSVDMSQGEQAQKPTVVMSEDVEETKSRVPHIPEGVLAHLRGCRRPYTRG